MFRDKTLRSFDRKVFRVQFTLGSHFRLRTCYQGLCTKGSLSVSPAPAEFALATCAAGLKNTKMVERAPVFGSGLAINE